MKRLLALLFLFALLWACQDPMSNQNSPFVEPILPSMALLEAPPAACYAPTVTLMADQDIPTGTVRVGNDQQALYIVYETSRDWPLQKTAAFVGETTGGIPSTGNGNPIIGQFPHQSRHPAGTHEVVWEVPLDEVTGGGTAPETVVVAAFAEVGPEDATEGAWADGSPISTGRSWAMYFSYDLVDCAVEEITPSGGRVTTLDGTVTLEIPAGALQAPTEITIEPIDVSEIGNPGIQAGAALNASLSPRSEGAAFGTTGTATAADGATRPAQAVSAEGSLINGVLPVEETAYRFGPDGLEFDQPVEVTLEYDPAMLPAGTDEQLLTLFVTNAIFQPLESTVDPANHTVTGFTTHFSDYFIGIPTESDLLLTSLTASPNPARYDHEFTLSIQGAVSPDGAPVSSSEVAVQFSGVPFLVPTLPPECIYDGPNASGGSDYLCDPGSLNPGDVVGPFDFVVKPYAIYGQAPATLDITTEITPTTGSGVSDTDPSNNAVSLALPVLPDAAADLRVSGAGFSPVEKKAGREMTVTAIVESKPDSPDPVDAYINFQFEAGAAGLEVVSDQLPTGCTYAQGLSGTSVTCGLGTINPGDSRTTQIVVIPLQVGGRSVTFTAEPEAGDINPGDNSIGGSYVAEASMVDLAVQIDESFDPILADQTVAYSATVESLASSQDPLPRGVLRIQAQGDVEFFNASDGCEDVSGLVAGVDAAVNCPLPELAPGEAAPDFMALVVRALSPDQEIQAEALLLLPDYVDDPDESNNSATETTRVSADIEADLQLTEFSVSPDPARAYQELTYRMEVSNPISSANDVAGATLELLIEGTVETLSIPYFCNANSLGFPPATTITCELPELIQGTPQPAFATVRPAGSMVGSDLDATATVILPSGALDTDESNNSGNLITPVVAGEADLLLAPIEESADPVQEGETLTYSLRVGNSAGSDSPDDAPEGSKITMWLTSGDADLVSMSPDCADLSAGGPEPVIVQCSFGPLPPGAITPYFDIEVEPIGAPQTLELTAEVTMLTGMTEVNPADNTRTETTTVNPVQPITHVYVVNQGSDNVSVVDAATDAVIQTITVADNPYAAAITPDGSEVWVSHATGYLDIIDTGTNTATLNVLRITSGIQDLAFSPDGSRAYVTHPSAGAVTVVDVANRTSLGTITGLSFPRGIAVLSDGSRAYVAGNEAVYVLDLSNNTLASTLTLDGGAFFAAASPDDSEVFITQRPSSGAGLVRTIDTGTDSFVGPGITVGFNPYAIGLNPSGSEAYVADSSNRLYFVDLAAQSVITSITVDTNASSRLGLTSDGSSLFLSSYSDPGSLYEIDTATRSVAATTAVGAYPIGVAVKQ